MTSDRTGRPAHCPPWCVLPHAVPAEQDDDVHVGGALMVQRTTIRLWMSVDPTTGARRGPFVVLGAKELTLHEAETLLASLTQLVDEARSSLLAQETEGALPVLDA